MRMLTLNECGLVTGGLMPRAGGMAGQSRITAATRAHPNMYIGPPSNHGGIYGGGGGGYYGFLNDITGGANYAGLGYFQPNAQYADSEVQSGDTLYTAPDPDPVGSGIDHDFTAVESWIDNSAGGQIAKGITEMTLGSVAVGGGAAAVVASDGILAPLVGTVDLAFGAKEMVNGYSETVKGIVHMLHDAGVKDTRPPVGSEGTASPYLGQAPVEIA